MMGSSTGDVESKKTLSDVDDPPVAVGGLPEPGEVPSTSGAFCERQHQGASYV